MDLFQEFNNFKKIIQKITIIDVRPNSFHYCDDFCDKSDFYISNFSIRGIVIQANNLNDSRSVRQSS